MPGLIPATPTSCYEGPDATFSVAGKGGNSDLELFSDLLGAGELF